MPPAVLLGVVPPAVAKPPPPACPVGTPPAPPPGPRPPPPPAGIVTVVKWKTPSGGSVSVTLLVGAKGPSAPVLPLLNVCARAADGPSSSRPTTTLSGVLKPRIVRLLAPVLTARGSLHTRLTAP